MARMSKEPPSRARIERAASRARDLADRPEIGGREGARRARWLAIGDPQTTPERFFGVLEGAGLLADDGRLRSDVGLVSVGDHFDFGRDAAAARDAGPAILGWLAAHPRDQVVILAGNHDVARVDELAGETDESFAEARALAQSVDRGAAPLAAFHERFPSIATPELVLRDYSGFAASQRALVQRLLLEGRMALAAVGRASIAPDELLLAHTAITARELDALGLPRAAGAAAIVESLAGFLRDAVARVAPRWRAGELAPLDLAPMHLPGRAGEEGGGFLYHRPGDPEGDGGARRRDFEGARPRRFDARALPEGLAQVVGHDPHQKRAEELARWTSEAARAAGDGHLRTLQVEAGAPRYELGLKRHRASAATLYMIDAGLGRGAERVPLFPLERVEAP